MLRKTLDPSKQYAKTPELKPDTNGCEVLQVPRSTRSTKEARYAKQNMHEDSYQWFVK